MTNVLRLFADERTKPSGPLRRAKPSCVYIIGYDRGARGHALKIGISDNVPTRFNTLQSATPEDLVLHFAFSLPDRDMALWVEQSFHKSFRHRRIRGEWFNLPPEGALALVATFVVRVLSNSTGDKAALRRGAGLLGCFALLDQMSTPDEQAMWDRQFDEHAVPK